MMTPIPGKRIGDNTYVHVEALSGLSDQAIERVRSAETVAGIERSKNYNIVRMHGDGGTLALLSYPRFFEDPFPALQESWLVDLSVGSVRHRTYADSLNPPILHRKELLLPSDDPLN
jgi:hypothetical protein